MDQLDHLDKKTPFEFLRVLQVPDSYSISAVIPTHWCWILPGLLFSLILQPKSITAFKLPRGPTKKTKRLWNNEVACEFYIWEGAKRGGTAPADGARGELGTAVTCWLMTLPCSLAACPCAVTAGRSVVALLMDEVRRRGREKCAQGERSGRLI